MSVVKTAHWALVKLWEARADYQSALKAHEVLKQSKLVECQPEELRVVEATAKQYRWTDLKKRGDELFAEGQYPACRALHEKALAEPELYLANTSQRQVSEQIIKNCEQKAKHEKKVAKKSRGSSSAKAAAEKALEERRAKQAADEAEALGAVSEADLKAQRRGRRRRRRPQTRRTSPSPAGSRTPSSATCCPSARPGTPRGGRPSQPAAVQALADAKISCSSGSSGGGGGSKAQHAEAQHFLQLHQQQLQRQQQMMLEAQLKQSNSVAVSFMAVHNEEDLDVQIPDDVELAGILRHGDEKVVQLQRGMDALHAQLSNETAVQAPRPPKRTFHENMTKMGGKWPCRLWRKWCGGSRRPSRSGSVSPAAAWTRTRTSTPSSTARVPAARLR